MKTKFIYFLLFCIIVLTVSFGMITKRKMDLMNAEIGELSERVDENNQKISELQEKVNVFWDKTEALFNDTFDYLIEMQEQITGIGNTLTNTKTMVSSQYNKTVQLAKTYDSILEEEKKKRVDDSEHDIEINSKRLEYKKKYISGKYDEAYKLCNEILLYDKDDLEARYYRMLSLFNINRMDSSNYPAILEDCEVLKLSGYKIPEVENIENLIQMELKSEE